MEYDRLPPGKDPPNDLTVVIEIPCGGGPVKYELDKATGLLNANRVLRTSMRYPANYGFIPGTLSEDGDPCDALVMMEVPLLPGSTVSCRPIGALTMTDEHGPDEKILMVPVDAVDPRFAGIRSWQDLRPGLCDALRHFFEHYKELEAGTHVTLGGWVDAAGAADLVMQAIARAG